MTLSIAANPSRQAVVLAAIAGLHVTAFLLATTVADVRMPWIEPAPPVWRPTPKPSEAVKRLRPDAVKWGGAVWDPVPEPRVTIPPFADPPSTRHNSGSNGGETGSGPAVPRTVELAPSLRVPGSRLSALINACYPTSSRRLSEEGRAVVRLSIGADGRPVSWTVAQGSGFARLDAATGCVIRRLEFAPGRRDGRAVEAVVSLPIVFQLD